MPDMLVRLYDLPPREPALARAAAFGVVVRRALAPEKPIVLGWVGATFRAWHAEAEIAFAFAPVRCFVAVADQALVGFACHDVICRNFFGPTGVAEGERGRGIGVALLLATLHAQREAGYAYAIIGGTGPEAFYAHTVGATAIAGSTPGVYRGLLRARD